MSNSNAIEFSDSDVEILYTNYREETTVRRIRPLSIVYKATSWHPEDQWLLVAFDYRKNENRSFAIKDIKNWKSLTK